MNWFYRCPACGRKYDIEPGRYICDACAASSRSDRPPKGILECAWDGEIDPAFLKNGVPLPVEAKYFPAEAVGQTPLVAPDRLRELNRFPGLFLKDDTREPTASFKDRASIIVAAFARRHSLREVALASTGNAASSMAGIGAAAGLKVTVFLPKTAPAAKRIQVLQYGAELRVVDGNYDRAYEESLEYSSRTRVLSRNTAYNPLTIEGKKTAAWEIIQELHTAGALTTELSGGAAIRAGDGPRPLEIFVPVGDGVILAGLYKGFEELVQLGRLARVPRLWACQAAGSAAIARALRSGEFGDPVAASTLADSISVDVPRNGEMALTKLRTYSGRAVVLGDEAILAAQRELSAYSGVFAEPAAAAAYAGFKSVKMELAPNALVVLLLTGSGLKDIASAARAVGAKV